MAKINSVKRSDSKILTVGDIVNLTMDDETVTDEITGFYDLGQKALLATYDWVDCDDETLAIIYPASARNLS
jgi:hypothetical protein